MSFANLGLLPQLLSAIQQAGYEVPTPIQGKAIPPALEGKDVLGCAQTGTGKTAAFCLPALQQCELRAGNEPALRVLILTPTRELAAQINESLATYGKNLELWHAVIFGGVSEKPQIEEIRRGIDILVATPGRLLDLLGRRLVKLDQIELFVLDEADRMLDMGFINDVKKITAQLPKKRQTLFFSATMPPAIRQLASALLDAPVEVAVTPVASTVDLVSQHVYFTDQGKKKDLLVHLLRDPSCTRTVVFAGTKHRSDRIARHLERQGLRVAAIHGNKAQNARTRALDGFRDGRIDVLVATDIAARGIDVDGVSHVINFDLPNVSETYVHRIGRTARAGNSGVAISFCDAEERDYLRDIEKLIGKRLEPVAEHPFPASARAPEPQDRRAPTPQRGGRPHGNKPGRSQGGRRGGRRFGDQRRAAAPAAG
jgi:ATP-dependent RNA helicase RhlE